jgi:predicted MPP superfamily phosphohydrolase
MLFPPFGWSQLWSSDPQASQATKRPTIALRRFAGPGQFEGKMRPLRIAHLTDLHVGRVTPMRMQREAVALTNAQAPDLVVITGDFVCHSQLYLDELSHLIQGFNAPVFAVLGNHDYWAGAGEVEHALRRARVQVLHNQHTLATFRGQPLQIVGLDDAYTGHADIEKATKGLRLDVPTLALSHIAEEADALWARGIPLVLAGHTHGGQVTVARLHEITLGRIGGHRYVHGLYGDRGKTGRAGAVYVGAGIGASVMPVRLGDRGKREVALFELGVGKHEVDEHHDEQPPLPGRPVTQKKLRKRIAKVEAKRAARATRRTAEIKTVD